MRRRVREAPVPAPVVHDADRAGLVRFEQVAISRRRWTDFAGHFLTPELRREFALTHTGRRVDLVRAFDDLERTRQRVLRKTEILSGDSGGCHECNVRFPHVLSE